MSDLTLRVRPPQRISFSQKNKQWREEMNSYWCDQADRLYYNDWKRMHENSLFYNNIFDQEEFQKYCDPLGLDTGSYTDYVQAFNKLPNKINTLVGEEIKRPFSYFVKQLGIEATNEVIRQKEADFRQFVETRLQQEIEMQQAMVQAQIESQANPEMAEELYEQMVKEIQTEHQRQNEGVLDLGKIKLKYKNYKTSKEKLANVLLRHFITSNKVRHKKNEGFFQAAVNGVEAVHVYQNNGRVKLEVVNPLGLAWHKSPEEQFMQNGDAVTYKREMTVGDVMDFYGNFLADKDLKAIESHLSRVYGLDAKLYSKDGYSPSHFENRTKNFSRYGDSNVRHAGSYGQGTSDESFLTVYTTYWRSQREVGFLSFINDYGDDESVIVDETYPVPKYAQKMKYKTEEGADKERFVWDDEITGQPYSIQWEWVPQIWHGTRIEDNIHVNVAPLYGMSISINNPKEQKLPILGLAYSNNNAPITSLFDRGKPWQKLFLAVMHKWTQLIMQDKSVLHTIDVTLLDKDIPLEIALRYAQDMGIIPYNSLSNAEGAGMLVNTRKLIETHNLSNPSIERYTKILEFLDFQISEAVGVSKPREGQMAQYSTATDNQQSIIQSSHITEGLFSLHDLLWEDVLNCAMKLITANVANYKGWLREIISDDEIAIIDLGEMSEWDEFSISVVNSQKVYDNINMLKANMQSMIQNDENALNYILAIMDAESMSELREQIDTIQQDIEQRRAAMEQSQSAQMERIEQMKIEAREDEQAHEIELEMLKIEGQLLKAEIDAFKFQRGLDSDNNQIPDHLEIEKFKQKANNDSRRLDLEEKKLEQQKEIEEKKIKAKKNG